VKTRSDLRLSLPSRGRLGEAALEFLHACGLAVDKPNPRQYVAQIASLPSLSVLFQRPGDIVVSVRDGSVDFGITGRDMVAEHQGTNGSVLLLHDALGFGQCRLCLAVPEAWEDIREIRDLPTQASRLGRPLRVATKFPHLTEQRLASAGVPSALVHAEGTLEVAPTIGYADLISDLVSSGQTLRDNRLRPLEDGDILVSQAVLIANRDALQCHPEALDMAQVLLEFFEAHLRAADHLAVFANMRGSSPDSIAKHMFAQETLGGLQGPTFSRVVAADGDPNWFAVHIIVRRKELLQAVSELRAIGGSGVVVTPVTYIFEEEPARVRAMLEALQSHGAHDQAI
jgi:ATP phosphoribosyltransferase